MPSVLRKAPYHSFSILYSIIYISTTTGRYLGYTVSILRVPSDTKRRALLLPVPARSDIGSYGTTGTSLMRQPIDHFTSSASVQPDLPTLPMQGQSAWAPTGGPGPVNRTAGSKSVGIGGSFTFTNLLS